MSVPRLRTAVFKWLPWVMSLGAVVVLGVIGARALGPPVRTARAEGGGPEGAGGARWACEMGCEGAKGYVAPGSCPVCGMALSRQADRPYRLSVTAVGGVLAGAPSRLRVRVMDPDGKPVGGFDGDQKAPVLCAIVSEDLAWHWGQVLALDPEGSAEVGVTLPAPGRYQVLGAFRPAGLARQTPAAGFSVAGVASERAKLEEDFDSVLKDGEYEFRIRCNGARFFAGTMSYLRFGVDREAQAVGDLEPVIGEPAGVLIISAASGKVVNTHAMSAAPFLSDKPDAATNEHIHKHAGVAGGGPHPATLRNGKATDVVVEAVFPEPGLYRVLAFFKHQGRLISVGYTIDAQRLPPVSGN